MKLIKCSCGSEMLELEFDEEMKSVFMVFWKKGFHSHALSFKDRLRCVWTILTTGNPWTDSLILGKAEVEQVIETLNSFKEKCE